MRRAGPALLALLLAGCLPELPQVPLPHEWQLVKPPPPLTDVPRVPHAFALGLISRRRVDRVTLRVYNTGTMRTRGEAVSAMKSFHARLKLPVPAFVVNHPDEGPVLFDTGLSSAAAGRGLLPELIDHYTPSFFAKRGQDLVTQLAKDGVAPGSIRWVVLSDLHSEHAGMAHAFPNARVVVSREEWDWAKAEASAGRGRAFADLAALEPRLYRADLSTAPAFGAIGNGLDFFGDGSIVLVGFPGHTPGSIGLWANLDGGPVLLTGDAALVMDAALDLSLPVKNQIHDLRDYWRTLHVIRAMRKAMPQLVLFPGHDLTSLKLVRRADITSR